MSGNTSDERDHIAVGAHDTLDRVLDRVRASTAGSVVLDVDERSSLLISLQQLHRLDEVAQECGIDLAVASANSKLLNAARVFGLAVIDTRTESLPPGLPAVSKGTLLAGEPLGRIGAAEAAPDAAAAEPVAATATRPAVMFKPVTIDPVDGWDSDEGEAANRPPLATHAESATPPARRTRAPRLDPYGQPYADDDEPEVAWADNDDDAPIPDEEGWDSEAAEEGDDWDDQPRRRGGFGAFWSDVRAWMDARRGVVVDDEEEFADDEPAAERDWEAEEDSPPREDDDSAAVEEVEEAVPQPRRTIRPLAVGRPTAAVVELPASPSPARRSAPPIVDSDEEGWDDAPAERPARPLREPRERRSGAGLGALLFGIVALALALLVVLYLLVPNATVTLTARTGTVTTSFNVVVGEIDPNSPQGQPTQERIVVPAKRITVPVSASATRPATGARLEPDGTATGSVALTNPSTEPVTVAKGTELPAGDGRNYVTLEAVTVGASDPFASAAFGAATVQVAAEIKGSGGNADLGVVKGRLQSGVYYTNKAAISGGTDRRIPTIAKQDLAAAQTAAEDAARTKGLAAISGAVPAGSAIMHDTAGVGNFAVQFNAKEGADGDSVTATVTAQGTALTWNQADVQAQARAEAERRLNALAVPGEPIVPGSMQLGTPQVASDVPGTLTYAMTGTASTRAAIGGDTERARLADELARKSDSAARDVLAGVPGVSTYTIEYHTGPFPQRMPWLASHITVRVAGAP
ncbi:MAG: hypothetical protein ACTHMU_22985 [Thermomicrobiales bacterium]